MKDTGIPDLFIEKLLLDELPQEVKERLLEDPSVRRRLEELKRENRRILEDYPPEQMAKAISNRSQLDRRAKTTREAREGRQSKRPGRFLFARQGSVEAGARMRRLVPAAAFVLLVLVGGLMLISRGPGFFAPQGQAGETRLKGGAAHLNVYMKTDGGARLLEEGDRVTEGATLQIEYVSGANEYGVILSIDGRGTVTLHFPLSPATGENLEGEGEVLLPFAYTLDDAPAFERFFFVFSERPFSVDTVLEAADRLSKKPETAKSLDLPLPGGLEQSSILLLK
jgi:hypothetical protein